MKKKQTYNIGDHIFYNHQISRYEPTHEIRTGIIEGYDTVEPDGTPFFESWKYVCRNGNFLVKGTNISHFRVDSVSYDSIIGLEGNNAPLAQLVAGIKFKL